MNRITHDRLVYYQFEMWRGVTHGVFTRKGGDSVAPFASLNLGGNVGDDPRAVRANHERMYASLGIDEGGVCSVWQVHSADVIIANAPVGGRRWLARADAMMTDRAGITLSMRFADCVPILFRDPVRDVIAMAHAGWRGTVQGIGAETVRAMTATYGSRPADIEAGIGPSIGPEHYQVGEEVVDAVRAHFGATDGLIRRDPADGSAYLDLWAANRRDLERAGVGQIEIAGISTADHTDEFFSHRAEQGRTGRFGAVLSLS
ncbi:MAG: peptidoglycan editing factor PgeF [Anaerolineae bacterium]|nr:peptidoglycan editing factor PgeF [Anaerolineae bacterium]